MEWEESEFNCWGGQGARVCVILVLRECIWKTPAVSLVLSAFDDTVSPSWVLHVSWSIPMVPPWVTASRFLVRNTEA